MKQETLQIPAIAYETPVILDAADLAGALDIIGGCSGTCCTGGNGVVE